MKDTPIYKLIDKYYQNKCTKEEAMLVVEWLKQNFFDDKLDDIMNSQWNSITDINKTNDIEFKKLIEIINSGII